ncbi:MAG: radical SAM protein [Marinifilaceae bacterium]|nr:radical SAM protein [Marinifilaceae bacterium]
MFSYDYPLFRPPSEAYSFILQITYGCSWNKCHFCEMYKSKKFKIRDSDDIINDIKSVSELNKDIKKVFLADGNALVLKTESLIKILSTLKSYFPKLSRVSAYASSADIENKSIEELKLLKENGLDLLYVGIESGNNQVLEMISKREDYNLHKSGLKKAKNAGIKLSVMIINGLGGKTHSEKHATDSAKLINDIQPEFLSTLVLSFPNGEDYFKNKLKEEFHPLNQFELIQELEIFISKTELNQTVFRSDHASNYLVLRGNLGRDKELLLTKMRKVLNSKDCNQLRDEWMRGL